MLLDPMGGIVITNDGHCILREVDVSHPTAKSMMELSRAQDEEVGDGTTSVIILAGEMLVQAEPFLRDASALHPTVIVQAYHRALQEALQICERYDLLSDFVVFCFVLTVDRTSDIPGSLSLWMSRTLNECRLWSNRQLARNLVRDGMTRW